MILIFKHKKIADKGTEKTLEILQRKLSERNVDSDVASFEDVELYIEKSNVKAVIGGKDLSSYNSIFFRRVGEQRNLAHMISLIAKSEGIPFVDRLYGATNEPGKVKQTTVLALNEISVPKSFYAFSFSKDHIDHAISFLKFPIVVKSSRGRKGKGVYLANDRDELESILEENKEAELLLQEFIPNEFDYRVLVLDGTVACVEKRIRTNANDFRNNVALGAREEFLEVELAPQNILKLAIEAANKADIQVAGVDIVESFNGEAFVFEVNRAPAFTHDENISNEINKLAEYLVKCDRKKIN